MLKPQFQKMAYAIRHHPYGWLFVLWVIIFLGINVWLNQIYVIGFEIFNYRMEVIVPYLIFTLLNTLLAGLSVNLVIIRVRELGSLVAGASGGFSALGALFALITGACPGCIAGLLPAFLGLLGAPIGITDLPIFGLLLQVVSMLLMLVGIYFLTKPVTCEVEG